jgi:glutathione S-transferase
VLALYPPPKNPPRHVLSTPPLIADGELILYHLGGVLHYAEAKRSQHGASSPLLDELMLWRGWSNAGQFGRVRLIRAIAAGLPPSDPDAFDASVTQFQAKMRDALGELERLLEERGGVAFGAEFSMLDIAYAHTVALGEEEGASMDDLKQIEAWRARLKARPAFADR